MLASINVLINSLLGSGAQTPFWVEVLKPTPPIPHLVPDSAEYLAASAVTPGENIGLGITGLDKKSIYSGPSIIDWAILKSYACNNSGTYAAVSLGLLYKFVLASTGCGAKVPACVCIILFLFITILPVGSKTLLANVRWISKSCLLSWIGPTILFHWSNKSEFNCPIFLYLSLIIFSSKSLPTYSFLKPLTVSYWSFKTNFWSFFVANSILDWLLNSLNEPE